MRTYLLIAGGVLAVVAAIGVLSGFFAKFEAKDWTTAALSIAALFVAGVTLVRGAVPQPSWSVQFRPPSEVTHSGGKKFTMFSIEATQDGPGIAERVGIQVKLPGEGWGRDNYPELPELLRVDRGRTVVLPLVRVDGDKTALPRGEYRIRILYRSLPDTSKVRRKAFRRRGVFSKAPWAQQGST